MSKINKLMAGLTLGLGLLGAGEAARAQASQATQWVADDLTTFVRSGPSNEYRIVGALESGAQVTVLETSGDYSRVRAADGDEVWIQSDQLQDERSLKERVPELRSRVESLSSQLESANGEWEGRVTTMTETLEARQQRIADLESRNAELDRQLSQAQASLRKSKARLDTQEEDLLMRYFMYGGGVAGAGLIVGLLVPHLPRRRSKRDRWF
ncbi:TIGR04211 family SH3 domain-containing protein [Halomonas sp. HP20-15]|uniref:TIGR04211 family SH3 domain-containing protein n=1 Tax=Halomonas sp. HP20-15 TaxID=3085901 RepID=UPI002981703A|nr:TIGR04211 family SH3 domain-containing protein [Halomonas sp. HP20-15]MDW5376781.1 TIGR04211 family SH3 domain-containing protein [Halomonas sp. HP20-15]